MKKNIKPSILQARPYIPGKPIEEVKREFRLKRVIKLASNENPFAPSPKVLKAIRTAALGVNRYPDGGCYVLRRKLAQRLKVAPEQLIFGNGSDEIIIFAARVFLKEGDEVVIAKPSFLIYQMAAKIEGAVVREVALKNFRYDLEAMKAMVNPKTRIVFLGNPDNPAGTYLTQKQVAQFLEGLPSRVLVFIDEAYYEYVTAKDYADSLGLIKKYPNLVVSRTFSKMYGLAGLRIGYAIGRPEIIDLLNRVREPFNVNSIAQAAAIACLDDQGYYKKLAKIFKTERKKLYRSLDAMAVRYEPSCTNFIQINVGPGAGKVARALLKLGVIVRDMTVWGLHNHIRVTIGTAQENVIFIKALKKILKQN